MSESSHTTTLKTQLLLLLLLATSITARKTARDLKNVFDEPVFSGIPNNATEDGDRYIVVFTDGSLEFLDRLMAAEANEEDDGDRVIRHLSAKSSKSNIKSNIKHHKAEKKNFLVKSSAEIILAATAEEAAEWETHEEVKYVEKGTCLEAVQSND